MRWWTLVAHGLWILGISIVVAAVSYLDWQARATGRSRRDLFAQPSWRLPWSAGMFLICAGALLAVATAWWEHVLWALLAMWFGRETQKALWLRRRSS